MGRRSRRGAQARAQAANLRSNVGAGIRPNLPIINNAEPPRTEWGPRIAIGAILTLGAVAGWQWFQMRNVPPAPANPPAPSAPTASPETRGGQAPDTPLPPDVIGQLEKLDGAGLAVWKKDLDLGELPLPAANAGVEAKDRYVRYMSDKKQVHVRFLSLQSAAALAAFHRPDLDSSLRVEGGECLYQYEASKIDGELKVIESWQEKRTVAVSPKTPAGPIFLGEVIDNRYSDDAEAAIDKRITVDGAEVALRASDRKPLFPGKALSVVRYELPGSVRAAGRFTISERGVGESDAQMGMFYTDDLVLNGRSGIRAVRIHVADAEAANGREPHLSYAIVRISPDGKRAAVEERKGACERKAALEWFKVGDDERAEVSAAGTRSGWACNLEFPGQQDGLDRASIHVDLELPYARSPRVGSVAAAPASIDLW